MISYCVVNTNGGDLLGRCLDSIEHTHPGGEEREILVLDNASDDGSAAHARGREGVRLIELERRTGKAENDSTLLQEARGELCLLMNEDAELLPGAPAALIAALRADPRAAVAGAQLVSPDGVPQPCAWRFPGVRSALVGALFLHKLWTVQRGGRVDWVQSSAMLVRRAAAAEVGWLDARFFVYSDETDFQYRLRQAGWHSLLVPAARAIHHEQLSADVNPRRVVEFHRNRDLYMRKHHSRAEALVVRVLTAWAYGLRALWAGARGIRGGDTSWARRYALHARQALRPGRGQGMADR